jgi:hypothetical protein
MATTFNKPKSIAGLDADERRSAFVNGGGGSGGAVRVEDEGSTIVAAATGLNFVGTGVTVTDAGSNEATVTISSGGAGANLTWTAATSTVASDTGTDATLTVVDGTNPGLMTVADKTKLDGIATGATKVSSGVATVDLGYPTVFSKTVNVADANVTASSRMIVGWGLTTDLDVNDGEMDQVTFHPKPKAGSFDLTVSSTQPLGGVCKVSYLLV